MLTHAQTINRQSSAAPLYTQIVENLLERIEAGELVPGDRLPSERDLSETLGVNRLTLRRALRVLEERGLLVRRQGAGTYIAAPKIERPAGRLTSFTRGMQRRGLIPGARIILFEERPLERAAAEELALPVGSPGYVVHRLRLLNQEPVLLERYLIPADRFPDLAQHDLVNRSMYAIMQSEYGVVVGRARQSLEPVVATEYEAELLGVRPGAPLMLERRLSFDQDGRPVEQGKDLYRGDRFRFVTEMAPLE
ncbi:MAG: GntR family transcriptional regulator [Chloroflexota bacterium]